MNPFQPTVLRSQASFPWFQGKDQGWGQNISRNNPFHDMLHQLINSNVIPLAE